MNARNDTSFIFDNELLNEWKKIRKKKHISFSEYIKETITKDNLKYSAYSITQSVKAISGLIDSRLDYKNLKDIITDERLKDYENIH